MRQRGKKCIRQGTKSREAPQKGGAAWENGELDNGRMVAISPGWVQIPINHLASARKE
jgi:hypothetical protein